MRRGLGSVMLNRYAMGLTVLLLIFVGGLYVVKWNPYYHRAFVAATQHSIGASIVSGQEAVPPPASLAAGVGGAWGDGKSIWRGGIVGLVLGAGGQALVPRDWLARLFGGRHFKAVALAGLASVPSMM